jgi:hypothetical protein
LLERKEGRKKMRSKFYHVSIDDKRTVIECNKDGFDKRLPFLRRSDLLMIAKSCRIKVAKDMYDFEITDKIQKWRPPPSLSYSRRDLVRLKKNEILFIFKVHNVDCEGVVSKNELIELFLQLQTLHCDEEVS